MRAIGRPPLDLRKMRFGRLTARKPTDRRVGGSVVWQCRCDCGRWVAVPAKDLVPQKGRRRTESCGCSRLSVRDRYAELWDEGKSVLDIAEAGGVKARTVREQLQAAGRNVGKRHAV